MKTTILIAILLQGMNALACFGEAQIIAKADQVQRSSTGECHVTLRGSEVSHYSENMMCPLDLRDLLAHGMKVNNCKLSSGSPFSGVVVRDQNGLLFLE